MTDHSTFMRCFNTAADFMSMPETWQQDIKRYAVVMLIIIGVVVLDDYFHTGSFAFAAGYGIGGLTMYGSLRKHLKQ
jgi:hypothetical protein